MRISGPKASGNDGFTDDSGHDRFLWRGDRLHVRLRQAQMKDRMTLENISMLTVSVLLMVYLIYALLKPEKF